MLKRSYLQGQQFQPAVYSTAVDLLDHRAQTTPNKEAFIFRNKIPESDALSRHVVTFQELSERSLNVASALLRRGVRPGDRVAVYGPPSALWLFLDYAVLRIRVLLVRLPESLFHSNDLRAFLTRHQCRLLVVDHTGHEDVTQHLHETYSNGLAEQLLSRSQLECEAYPEMIMLMNDTCPDTKSSLTLQQLSKEPPENPSRVKEIQESIDPDNVAVCFPTSGSTGIPKLVVWCHVTYVNVVRDFFMHAMKVGDNTRYFNNRPFNWAGSFPQTPVVLGWPIVSAEIPISTDAENLRKMCQVCEEEQVNFSSLPMFAISSMVNHGISFPPVLKDVMTGGEPIPGDIVLALNSQGVRIQIGYGSTESALAHTLGNNQLVTDSGTLLTYRPAPNCEVKVASAEGQVLPMGQTGIIWFRSRLNFMHYLDNEEATVAIKDPSGSGWVSTQDAGIIHESEGFLEVIGRASNLISKGSCKVYPVTIETMLKKCDGVHQAVVLAVPDELYGQEIAACVVSRSDRGDLTVTELERFCQTHGTVTNGIPLYPKYFKIVDALPLSANGKVDVKALTKTMTELVGIKNDQSN